MDFIAQWKQCAADLTQAGLARALLALAAISAWALSPAQLAAQLAAQGVDQAAPWATSTSGSEEAGSLAAMARAADVVALVQVRDTDYLRRRDIPVRGSAFLEVLIPYKPRAPGKLLEVHEEGLHEQECYFPNPGVLEEGRRYLVFLRRDPENQVRYLGLPAGCAVDVLVDRDNRYAVRMPVTGLRLSRMQEEQLGSLARALDFADPYAVVEDEALPPDRRDALAAAGQIVPYPPSKPSPQDAPQAVPDGAPHEASRGESAPLPPSSTPRQWIYSRGVPLEELRRLLRMEADAPR